VQTVSLVVTAAAGWSGLAVVRAFELALWTIVVVCTSGRAVAVPATLIAVAGITARTVTLVTVRIQAQTVMTCPRVPIASNFRT